MLRPVLSIPLSSTANTAVRRLTGSPIPPPRLLPRLASRPQPHPRRPFTMSSSEQAPVITKTTDLQTSDAKWLALKKLEYTDAAGTSRTWEVAVRKTRDASDKNSVDAVAMGNIFIHPSKPPQTMLVIQYRPPLDAYTVEWPAGLIDKGETAEQAATREFKEETGYECKVLSVSPAQAADPGMSNANMQLVMVQVNLKEGEDMPEQRLDDGERIERVMVPLSEMYQRLEEYAKKDRYVLAAKLYHWAAGVEFARSEMGRSLLAKY